MTLVLNAVSAIFMYSAVIVFAFKITVLFFISRRCKVHIPIRECGKHIIYILLSIPALIYAGYLLKDVQEYGVSFTDMVSMSLSIIMYSLLAAALFIIAAFLPKAYLTENGIMSFYAFYPKDSAKFSLERKGHKIFIKIYTQSPKPDACYKISTRNFKNDAVPTLDKLYSKFSGPEPTAECVNYTHSNVTAITVIAALLAGILSSWYIIEKPVIFVGDKIIRTDSEYVLFQPIYSFWNSYLMNIANFIETSPEIGAYYMTTYENVDSTVNITSEDLKQLQKMPDLKYLSLYHNNITDLTKVGKLTQLEGLFLGSYYSTKQCEIPEDYSPLKDLTNLKYFSGRNLSNFTDISIFENADRLISLEITGADLQYGLDAVSSIENLIELRLTSCTADDFSPVGNCRNLKILDLSDTNVEDLSFLEDLNDLEFLSLGYTNTDNYNTIGCCEKLKVLNISGTNITDLSFLENLTNLESLVINEINIDDYSFLLEMPSLNFIAAYRDDIPDEIYNALKVKGVTMHLTYR